MLFDCDSEWPSSARLRVFLKCVATDDNDLKSDACAVHTRTHRTTWNFILVKSREENPLANVQDSGKMHLTARKSPDYSAWTTSVPPTTDGTIASIGSHRPLRSTRYRNEWRLEAHEGTTDRTVFFPPPVFRQTPPAALGLASGDWTPPTFAVSACAEGAVLKSVARVDQQAKLT
ncbi:hypothetical protein AOLI_G00000400 [Acnodon oligacanthus]